MKKQQVISRFFASKPGSSAIPTPTQDDSVLKEKSDISRAERLSNSSSVRSTVSVDFPPRAPAVGRRSLQSSKFSRGSPPSSSSKRSIDHTRAGRIAPSADCSGEEEKNGNSHPRKRQSRSNLMSPAAHLDVSLEEQGTQELQLAQIGSSLECLDRDYPIGESDHDSDNQLATTRGPDVLDSSVTSSAFGSKLEGDNSSQNQLGTLDGTLQAIPNMKRIKASSIQDKSIQFPPSDPVKHQRFVEKLLARIDANGEVKEAWHGNPPKGEKFTPLELQVVELKAKYPDVVLMVEVGYKYRFFGNDAETASRILGIFAHYDHNFLTASIPTFRLHVHVRRLVEAGFKVGVVRQTETAAIKAHGSNKAGPFTRGLSALYTRATLEAAEDLGGETEGRVSRLSSYLMCIAERPIPSAKKSLSKKAKIVGNEARESGSDVGAGNGSYDTEFGVVAVETATGDVMFGNFKDTVMRTELEGRLLICSPAELLLTSPLSSATEKLMVDFAGPASEIRVERVSRDCFKDGGALAEVLEFYAKEGDHEKANDEEMKEEKVDAGVEAVMAMPDIVVQALALSLRYLKQFNLEKVLRLGAVFRPFFSQNEMNLSPNALCQLEILKNSADGSENGSLLWLMNHTNTTFGARLLRHWVTHPLCDHTLIAARLDAVTEIAESMGSLGTVQIEGTFPGSGKGGGIIGGASRSRSIATGGSLQQGLVGGLLSTLGKMPDLERGITRIFHRTATAAEFVSVIQALITSAKQLQRLQFLMEGGEQEQFKRIKSSLLQRLISAVSSPTVCEHATHLLSALNTDAATAGDKLNLFNCTDGRFPEVAKCRVVIKATEKKLDGYLPSFQKLLHLPKLQYMSVNGLSYLIEVLLAQRVPADWIKLSSTKKSHRYHPPEVLETTDNLALAREELAAACTRAWDIFLAEFSSHYIDFRASVQALAALDCLHSLAVVSRNQGYTRPEFVGESEPSQLMIESGRHPVLDSTLEDCFVPNDTFLGGLKERCQIITGPNMGGKSCYIRQVALIAIMAQVGSYVPARSAKLHVFDSVHTRMGASDSLQKGASTFFEELSETSAILRSATSRSLVIVDELGRGTSTHDGVAIAMATLEHLLTETQCLTLFVTHYPKIAELKDKFSGEVCPYYVSYVAQESAASTDLVVTPSERVDSSFVGRQNSSHAAQSVTFLYKLVPGVASRSFGLHVARLAQIPETCVVRAATMAAKFENEVSDHNNFRAIVSCSVGAVMNRNFLGRGDIDNNGVDIMEGDTVDIMDVGAAPETRQTVGASEVNSAVTTGDTQGSWSLELRESADPEDGPRKESRQAGESEIRELFLLIRNALKHADDSEKSLSLLKDIQPQVAAKIQ